MKEYSAVIKVEFSWNGIEARDKETAMIKLKDMFYEEYGIKLENEEIIELKESE